jgi:phage gpG-like protein
MSVSLTIDASDTIALLDDQERRFAEPGDFLADIQIDLEDEMREHFFDESGPDGKWEELSEKYGEWKDANYPGMPILQREGDLIGSIGSQSAVGTTSVAEAFADDPKAVWHDEGTPEIPARPFGWISEEREDAILDKTDAYWGGD